MIKVKFKHYWDLPAIIGQSDVRNYNKHFLCGAGQLKICVVVQSVGSTPLTGLCCSQCLQQFFHYCLLHYLSEELVALFKSVNL